MDDVVETKIPLMDMPLGDLANDEDLLGALRHALTEPSRPVKPAGRWMKFGSSL